MKNKLWLLLIVLIGLLLRFVNLGKIPSGYSPDELAQGYTAYSIIQTGKDEWGNSNWLSLRSFGDYKPPIQTLLMIPSIKMFGLTPFAVRFPNAFLSIFTIILTYLIAQHLFKNQKISLLSALFISISPWSLPLSRIALEANVVVFITSLATYLFLKSTSDKNKYLFAVSVILFGLTLFTYHSAKIFTPLLLIILILNQKSYRQKNLLSLLLVIFGLFLFSNLYLNSQIKSDRTGDIAIFNPTDNWQYVSNSQYEITQNGLPHQITRIFYNKITYLFETFTQSFFSYFSPQFLITQGAGETTYGMIPGYGVLGFIPALGFIFSVILIIKKNKSNYFNQLIILFIIILIPPAIAAIAKGQYSGNRVSLMMPFLQIISAVGVVSFIEMIPNKFRSLSYFLFFSCFAFFSFIFLERYFFQGNQILSNGMLYGHKEANEIIQKMSADKIIYSRKLSEPQAYVAFFNQIDPKVTQSGSSQWLEYETQGLSFLDQLGEYSLGKFTFREINIPSDIQLPNTLIVGRPEEFRDIKPDYIIYYPSKAKSEASIYIYKTKL